MEVNPTEFWIKEKNKFPHLSKMAKEVLGVPLSSAPVEPLFSIAGKVSYYSVVHLIRISGEHKLGLIY